MHVLLLLAAFHLLNPSLATGLAQGGVYTATSTLLNGLQAYYALEGTTDSSGNGSTLTNHGTVTFVTGKVANAANFVSASSQYFSVADNSFFQMGTGSLTMAAWVKSSVATHKTICSYGAYNSAGYRFLYFNSELEAQASDGTHSAQPNGLPNIADGSWHFCVATFDRSGVLQPYVDNVARTSASLSTVTGSINTSVGFQIGADNASDLIDGMVDEVGIWNRVLTSTEITHLWNGGAGTTYPFTGL
jgi:hypothetical protein